MKPVGGTGGGGVGGGLGGGGLGGGGLGGGGLGGGGHIEEALAGIAKADRCQGHKDEPKKSGLLNRLLNR
jgi:hypothetical protein